MPYNKKVLHLIGGTYKGRNPFKYIYYSHILAKIYGHKTLRAIQHYATDFDSPFA